MGNSAITFIGGHCWGDKEELFVFDALVREFKSSNPAALVREMSYNVPDTDFLDKKIMYPCTDDSNEFVSFAKEKDISIIFERSQPDLHGIWWPQSVVIGYPTNNEYAVYIKMVYL